MIMLYHFPLCLAWLNQVLFLKLRLALLSVLLDKKLEHFSMKYNFTWLAITNNQTCIFGIVQKTWLFLLKGHLWFNCLPMQTEYQGHFDNYTFTFFLQWRSKYCASMVFEQRASVHCKRAIYSEST